MGFDLGALTVELEGTSTGFNKMLSDAEKKLFTMQLDLSRIGRQMTREISRPLEHFAKLAIHGTEEGNNLNKAWDLFAHTVGKTLLPFVERVTFEIMRLLDWWTALDQSTKDWLVTIGVAIAAIGPVLHGAILLIPAAIALVTDTVLELFGKTNLGLNNMVQNFRVGGLKISTWMQAAWFQVFDAWEYVVNTMTMTWNSFVFNVENLVIKLKNGVLGVFQDIVEGWLKARIAIGSMSDEQERKWLGVWDDVHGFFTKSLEGTLTDAAKLQADYYKTVDDMAKEANDKKASYDAALKDIFEKDAKDKVEEEKRFVTFKATLADPEKLQKGLEEKEFTLHPKAKEQLKDQSFLIQSLRRFNLDGPGGLSGGAPKKQEVHDPEVVKVLVGLPSEIAKAIANGKPPVAVLGK